MVKSNCGIINNGSFVQTGEIIKWVNFLDVSEDMKLIPEGFLLCVGQEVSKRDYADLYSVIGDNLFGRSPPDPDYFFIPDLSHRFLYCVDTKENYVGEVIDSANPNHKHAAVCEKGGGIHHHIFKGPSQARVKNAYFNNGNYYGFGYSYNWSFLTKGGHTHFSTPTFSNIGGSEFTPVHKFIIYLIK